MRKLDSIEPIIASYNDAQRTITMSKNDVVNVTKLNLSNSEIDDLEGLDVFSSLTNVDLSANKLTKDSSLEVLSNMPLTYLDLSSNEIICPKLIWFVESVSFLFLLEKCI